MTSRDDTDARPVIRDRRRIDPVTGKVREPASQAREPASQAREPASQAGEPASQAGEPGRHVPRHAAAGDDAAAATATQLAERTADLQRVQAEYANYRKRVERDRVAVREQALANVLVELLPALDNIDRAREHGELSGGFKSVADSIESAVTKLGLVRYGDVGEPFNPNIHDALMHSYSGDVQETTCVQILQPGYKVANRILRPARVAVAEPAGEPAGAPAGGRDEAVRGPAGEPLAGPAGEEQEPAPGEPETPPDRGS